MYAILRRDALIHVNTHWRYLMIGSVCRVKHISGFPAFYFYEVRTVFSALICKTISSPLKGKHWQYI